MITKHFRYVLGGALILGTSSVYPALAASPGGSIVLRHHGARPIKTAPSDSGISVQTYIGPTSPLYRIGDPEVYVPYAAQLVVFDASTGDVVTEFMTDKNGTATVSLPPGDYIVGQPRVGEDQKIYPRVENQPVTVQANEVASLTLFFDNGMR